MSVFGNSEHRSPEGIKNEDYNPNITRVTHHSRRVHGHSKTDKLMDETK